MPLLVSLWLAAASWFSFVILVEGLWWQGSEPKGLQPRKRLRERGRRPKDRLRVLAFTRAWSRSTAKMAQLPEMIRTAPLSLLVLSEIYTDPLSTKSTLEACARQPYAPTKLEMPGSWCVTVRNPLAMTCPVSLARKIQRTGLVF